MEHYRGKSGFNGEVITLPNGARKTKVFINFSDISTPQVVNLNEPINNVFYVDLVQASDSMANTILSVKELPSAGRHNSLGFGFWRVVSSTTDQTRYAPLPDNIYPNKINLTVLTISVYQIAGAVQAYGAADYWLEIEAWYTD
jgi:hypothetical protein